MSKFLSTTFYLVAILVFSLFFSEKTMASHSMGADLTYQCVGGNTYKVRLSFYRDCYGVAAPINASISINSASCGQSLSVTCYKIPGTGQEITPICPSVASTCNGGVYTGIEEWIYEGTVVLPMQCTDWVFSFDLCCRNTAITTIDDPGADDFYIYSTLNNTVTPCNNSPTFSNKPVPFICLGQEFCFNHGATDSDGDSLVYSLITPLVDPGMPVTYFTPYSPIQPLNSVPAMQFDSENGNICMTPQSLEITVMAVLVQEYRNGVLIGSVERDIQVTVMACTNNLPTMSGINGTTDITATICADQPFCFDVFSDDVDGGQNLIVEYDQGIPGATFSATSAQHPTGTFCWTPSTANISAQPYCFTLSVHDDACPYMGYQVYSYCLTVTGLTADAGADQYLGCNTTTTIQANGNGGNPPYSYLWSTGSNSASISVGPGTYILTVSDGLCSNQDTINVTNVPTPVIASIPVTDVLCNGGSDGTITVNANGGSGAIQYSIDNGATFQASNVFSGLPIGNYQILIQDVNGCSTTAQTSISEPPLLTAGATSVTATCTNSNGSITITANGGNGAIQYSIDNGTTWQATNSFSGLATGNYDIIVQDANGCTVTTSIVVPDEPAPVITNIPVTDVLCNGGSDGSASVNTSGGTGTIEFSIDNGNSYQASNTFSGLPIGNYVVTIQDANGCTTSSPFTIAEPLPLDVNPSAVTATCTNNNGSITITANGGTGAIQYSIDNGSTYQSSNTFNNLATGNYDIMVTDANGCTAVSAIAVPDEPSPTILSTPVVDVTCSNGTNGTITVNINGGTGAIQYSIDNGTSYQASNSFAGLTAGVYEVMIQDANGCTAIASATITEPTVIVVNATSETATCTDNVGSITITASGGTGTLEYSIDNGTTYQLSNIFNGLATGNYDIMVQDANGCTATSAIIVPDAPAPVIVSIVVSNVTCFSGSDGYMDINSNGGTSPIVFSIDNGTTFFVDDEFSGLPAGNYQVIIHDANGCTAAANAIVNEPPEIILNSNTVSATCNGSNGSATVTGNGGTGTLEYSIDGGVSFQSATTFTGLTAGNYTITAQDDNGCQSNINAAVGNALAPVINAVQQDDITCNAGSDGSITINANGGTGTLEYSINNGTSFQANSTFTGLTAGNYDVVVRDANGCLSTIGVTLVEPDEVQFTSVPALATCGNNNGSLEINATGGTGQLEYSIDGGAFQGSNIFNNLLSGNYTILVQDVNGCSESSNAVVPGAPSPEIDNTPVSDVNCYNGSDGSIIINSTGGSGNIQYSIDNGSTYQSSNSFTGLTAGNYQISIIDTNGCTTNATVIIGEPQELVFSTSTVDATCNGSNGSLTVNGSGGTGTLEYSNDGGLTFQASATFNGLTAGSYQVMVQDANGCQVSAATMVNNALAPIINSIPTVNVTCNDGSNGSITVLANGGIGTLQYSIDNGTTYQAGNNFTNLPAGIYDVVVKDANGCLTTSTADLTEPDAVVFLAITDTATCGNSNGSLLITANGGTGILEYSIDSGSTFLSTNTFNNLASGNYFIVVQDANGCSKTDVANVINAPSPVIVSVNSTNLTCFGSGDGTLSINANGGTGVLEYSHNGGNTFQAIQSFNNLTAGNFNIIVQDANGCTATSNTVITQPPPLVINSSTTQAICGNSNGSLELNVTGGNGNYQYSVDSGATYLNGSVFNNLLAGNYFISVHDSVGCTASITVTVSNAQAPVISGVALSDVSCFGFTDGSISINASGGAGSLIYSINNGISYQPGNVFNNVPAGNYTVWVIDTNDCLIASTAIINQPPEILVNATTMGSSCGNSDGSVTVVASGGTGSFQFSIDSGATMHVGNYFPNMAAGNYNLIVEDSTGCQVPGIASVNNINGPVISNASSTGLTCFGSDNGEITITAGGGIGILNYSIDNGNTFQVSNSFDSLPGGMYSVVVVDINNCIATEGVNVAEPDPVSFNTLVTDATCGDSNGVIEVFAVGGTGNLQYSNNNGTAFQPGTTFNNLQSGNYQMMVQDVNGCSASAVENIINLASPVISPGNLTNVSCFGGSDGSASILVSGGTNPIFFQWSNGGTSQNLTGLEAGNYSVTVTDANSCSAVQSYTITQPPVLTASSLSIPVSCFGGNNGEITALPTGGTLPYTYNWSCGATTSIVTNLHAGNYSVTVSDSNGCLFLVTDSIISPSMLVLNTIPTAVNCFGNGNGSINTLVSGGTAPYSYLWSDGSVTSTISGLDGGQYIVTVTDFNNCITQLNTTVIEPPLLILQVAGSDTICINEQAIISASASGGTSPYVFTWNNGITMTSQVVTPINTTSYSVNVIDANGCTVAAQNVTVAVNPLLDVVTSKDHYICEGQSAIISAVASGGDGGPYNYTWSNNAGNASSSVVSPIITTTYEVIVSDNCGTPPVSDFVTITVHPVPQVNFAPLPPRGCVPLEVQFLDSTIVENGSHYMWSYGDGNSDSLHQNPVHIYYEPGSYTVDLTVISPYGCINTLSMSNAVTVYALPVADFVADPPVTSILHPIINFTDLSIDASDWVWDFGDAYGNSTDQHPQHSYRDTGTYEITLYILNQYGCADTSHGEVVIQGDFTLYIPNAFSPNGDGVNEYFFPQGIGITHMQMLIFDRWGQEIFVSNSMQHPWDGTNKNDNSRCVQDVYVYVIKATDLFDNGHNYTGRVTLLR